MGKNAIFLSVLSSVVIPGKIAFTQASSEKIYQVRGFSCTSSNAKGRTNPADTFKALSGRIDELEKEN